MRSNIKFTTMFILVAMLFAGCVKDVGVDEGTSGVGTTSNLWVSVMDSNGTKTLENYASTTFTEGDKIGLFVVIDGYLQQFNEPYTMNSQGAWTGSGSYWGDTNSGVYYFAYYPYREDYYFRYNFSSKYDQVTSETSEKKGLYYEDITALGEEDELWNTAFYDYTVSPLCVQLEEGDESGWDTTTDFSTQFFANMIDNWDIRVDQSKTNYTESDLMICQGYFTTSTLNTYPLMLKLSHQKSMMHFEFPEKFLFQLEDGSMRTEFTKDTEGNYVEDEAILKIYIDNVVTAGTSDVIAAGVADMETKLKDLSEDTGSIYEGSTNNFRYILEPHGETAQLHIQYTYIEGGVQVYKTFNPTFVPTKNSYVHYLMDDGQIPTAEGSEQQIRTSSTYPTCVGAFWKHDESGERIIKIQPAFEEDCGEWRAMVYKMDSNWDNTSDIRLDATSLGITYSDLDAENYQITSLSQTVSGNCTTTTPIFFRIGLTDEPFDMMSSTNEYVPARYAVVMLIYANNTKYQLIYIRQGEDPDYLYHTEGDTYASKDGYSISRANATKLSPYNLSCSALDVNATNYKAISNTTAEFTPYPSVIGVYTQAANNTSNYLDDKGGKNSVCWASCTTSGSSSSGYNADVGTYWDSHKATFNMVPQSHKSADNTRTFTFTRPNGGSTSTLVNPYNGTASQWSQSLYDDPLADSPTNIMSGYYADGYHDRIYCADQVYSGLINNEDYSSTGILFYNSRDFASVFFPTGSARAYNTTSAAIARISGGATKPTRPTLGYYWLSSYYANNYPYYCLLTAPTDTSGDSYADKTTTQEVTDSETGENATETVVTTEGKVEIGTDVKCGIAYQGNTYGYYYNIRLFVDTETVTTTE